MVKKNLELQKNNLVINNTRFEVKKFISRI